MSSCINTQDCNGNTCSSVPTETLARRVVQHADDVALRVCITSSDVPDFEHVIKCEVDGDGVPTGTQVLVIVSYANDGTPTMTYYNLVTGLVWVGDPADLRNCDDGTDTDLEMMRMCDEGTDFIRWIVTENGSPNGVSYDTDLTGATYVASGNEIMGSCFETALPTNIEGIGDITIGLTEVEIAITGDSKSIRIQADNSNTGIIYIGKTGVANDGSNDFVRLESGDEITMEYDDSVNALYAISDTAAQTINVGVIL